MRKEWAILAGCQRRRGKPLDVGGLACRRKSISSGRLKLLEAGTAQSVGDGETLSRPGPHAEAQVAAAVEALAQYEGSAQEHLHPSPDAGAFTRNRHWQAPTGS